MVQLRSFSGYPGSRFFGPPDLKILLLSPRNVVNAPKSYFVAVIATDDSDELEVSECI